MTATLTPSAMNADLALFKRIENRVYGYGLDVPRELQPVPTFDPMLRQADVIGACQTVNRYRYYGPKVRRLIAASDFLTGCSLAAMGVVVTASGLVMLAIRVVVA